jgi:hypothetical protein
MAIQFSRKITLQQTFTIYVTDKYYPGQSQQETLVITRDVESEGILGGVGVGKTYRLRLQPQSKILTRHSNTRALIATVTIRLILKYTL